MGEFCVGFCYGKCDWVVLGEEDVRFWILSVLCKVVSEGRVVVEGDGERMFEFGEDLGVKGFGW